MNKIGKIFIIALIFLMIILILPNNICFADVISSPGSYSPSDKLTGTGKTKLESLGSKLLTAISNIGVVVSVVSLAIVGAKYMLGSVEEKAKYKENIVPYLVGIVLVFGISTVVKITQSVGDRIFS